MNAEYKTYIVAAVSYLLGLLSKFIFELISAKTQHRRSQKDELGKIKRQSYTQFLSAITSIVMSDEIPSKAKIDFAREKLLGIEMDGSKELIAVSGILLSQLSWRSSGYVTSQDYLTPVYRKYALELIRADLNNSKPDLTEIHRDLLNDPLFALFVGKSTNSPSEGEIEILFDSGKPNKKTSEESEKGSNAQDKD